MPESLFYITIAQNSCNFISEAKLFVGSPLCSSLMLSLAISSLGKQEGGWCRKIIWTFGLTMDPTPPREVKGVGRGDSSGQYWGAQEGSTRAKRDSRNRRGDLKQVILSDQPTLRWSVRNVETMRAVNVATTEWGGARELLTVASRARHPHS